MGENSEWNDREKLLPRLSSKGIKMLRSGNRKQVRPQIGPLIGQKKTGPLLALFSKYFQIVLGYENPAPADFLFFPSAVAIAIPTCVCMSVATSVTHSGAGVCIFIMA